MPVLLGQLVGALVPTLLLSRLLLWVTRGWNGGFGRYLTVHSASLLIAALFGGMGRADGGAFAPLEAAGLYALPQVIWLVVDLLRAGSRSRATPGRPSAGEHPEIVHPEDVIEAKPIDMLKQPALKQPASGGPREAFGTVVFLGVIVLLIGLGAWFSQLTTTTGVVSDIDSSRYQGVLLNWPRAEVLYRLGSPSAVVEDTTEDGWARIYYTDTTRDPGNALPSGVSIDSFNQWKWEAELNGGVELDVGFDPQTNSVVSITCMVIDQTGQFCEPLNGIEIGATEEEVIAHLGQATRFRYSGASKTLRYDNLGVDYTLSRGRVYMMTKFQEPAASVE